MPKLDTSIYKGFLNSLEKAKIERYYVTLHFFRDPTIRGYVTEIDKEVYVATVESEEGNCSQIRLNQITSIMWKKNLTPTEEINTETKNKNRRKNLNILADNREKQETETATEYMKNHPTEADKKANEKSETLGEKIHGN